MLRQPPPAPDKNASNPSKSAPHPVVAAASLPVRGDRFRDSPHAASIATTDSYTRRSARFCIPAAGSSLPALSRQQTPGAAFPAPPTWLANSRHPSIPRYLATTPASAPEIAPAKSIPLRKYAPACPARIRSSIPSALQTARCSAPPPHPAPDDSPTHCSRTESAFLPTSSAPPSRRTKRNSHVILSEAKNPRQALRSSRRSRCGPSFYQSPSLFTVSSFSSFTICAA
jgi:hypothetical protein